MMNNAAMFDLSNTAVLGAWTAALALAAIIIVTVSTKVTVKAKR